MSTSPDTRVYATVLITDHSLQIYLTVGANILATPLNFLSFYLILTKSKRERSSFKICLFLAQLSYYVAQFHLGVLTGPAPLLPFPGVYSTGILKRYVSSFTLCFIWSILFCCYAYFTLLLLVIRLRIVARPGKFFDCSNFTYNFCYILLAIYVFLPVPGITALSYRDQVEQEMFVSKNFPNNMMVFNHPGVYIFTFYENSRLISAVLVFVIISALMFIIFMYIAITKEIELGIVSKSSRNAKESRKTLSNLVLQSTSYAVFLSITICLVLKSFYNDPSTDPRVSNTIAFTSLCAASIPCQIMMIARNTAYRAFVCRKTKVPSILPVQSIHITSTFVKV